MFITIQSSLRDLNIILQLIPGDKSPGYYQSSLRDSFKQLLTSDYRLLTSNL